MSIVMTKLEYGWRCSVLERVHCFGGTFIPSNKQIIIHRAHMSAMSLSHSELHSVEFVLQQLSVSLPLNGQRFFVVVSVNEIEIVAVNQKDYSSKRMEHCVHEAEFVLNTMGGCDFWSPLSFRRMKCMRSSITKSAVAHQ